MIADFGLARALSPLQSNASGGNDNVDDTNGKQVISQYYQSWMRPPEGLLASKALDVFCFGHILREAITGKSPFAIVGANAVKQKKSKSRQTPNDQNSSPKNVDNKDLFSQPTLEYQSKEVRMKWFFAFFSLPLKSLALFPRQWPVFRLFGGL